MYVCIEVLKLAIGNINSAGRRFRMRAKGLGGSRVCYCVVGLLEEQSHVYGICESDFQKGGF